MSRLSLALPVAAVLTGCGGSPFEGTWKTTAADFSSGVTLASTLDLAADGTVTATVEPTKTPPGVVCSGSLRATIEAWTPDFPFVGDLYFSGRVSCKSNIDCTGAVQPAVLIGGLDFGCDEVQGMVFDQCTYTLLGDNKLKIFFCNQDPNSSDVTYTRED